jgi:hypothetical protein
VLYGDLLLAFAAVFIQGAHLLDEKRHELVGLFQRGIALFAGAAILRCASQAVERSVMCAHHLVGQHALNAVLGIKTFVKLERTMQTNLLFFVAEPAGIVEKLADLGKLPQIDLPRIDLFSISGR